MKSFLIAVLLVLAIVVPVFACETVKPTATFTIRSDANVGSYSGTSLGGVSSSFANAWNTAAAGAGTSDFTKSEKVDIPGGKIELSAEGNGYSVYAFTEGGTYTNTVNGIPAITFTGIGSYSAYGSQFGSATVTMTGVIVDRNNGDHHGN